MSHMSVSLTLFKPPSFWDLFDLNSILQKGDELFKSLHKFRYLGVEDFPNGFLKENCLTSVYFLENRTNKITAEAYFPSITDLSVASNRLGMELFSLLTTTF